MSEILPHPEPPRESPDGESGKFYVVVDGSAEEELPPATDSEAEFDPTSARLSLLDSDEGVAEPEPEAPEDVDPAVFVSDVAELESSDDGFVPDPSASTESGVELLERHPEFEGESPFAPLDPDSDLARIPAPGPSPEALELAPLRPARRRDEYFGGSAEPYTPHKELEPSDDPDPNAAPQALTPVDASALPDYVVADIEAKQRNRAQSALDYHRAHRAWVGQVAAALALAFVVMGQIHGALSLVGSIGIVLAPWDALLGAGAGVLLTREPNSLRGQLYLGVAAAVAMGTKLAIVVPSGRLDGISLLMSFVISVGCAFGAIVGGGLLGLSLEQQVTE